MLYLKNWESFFPLLSKSIQTFVRTFSLPLFFKLKFKGKGYYVFKNRRNTISPQFGFSHRLHLYSFSLVVRFLSKTKVFLIGFSKKDLFKVATEFKSMKPINVFTGRGVRFAKQVVYRKTGKVSLYR
jgi:ribosomal protein L6P/L9E